MAVARSPSEAKSNVINLVRVNSFDYDSCLAPSGEIPSHIVKLNEKLFNKILEETKEQKINESIIMVGSNRQSFNTDQVNEKNKKNGSCFKRYQKIEKFFTEALAPKPCHLDKYLLADGYHHKEAGDSFNCAMTSAEETDHSRAVFDSSKVSLLYAQMHRVATLNKSSHILFCFYDDSKRILHQLEKFYDAHPEMIPNNVTLKLHRYKAKKGIVDERLEKKGSGMIDTEYNSSLIHMAEMLGSNTVDYAAIEGHQLKVNKFLSWRNKALSSQEAENLMKNKNKSRPSLSGLFEKRNSLDTMNPYEIFTNLVLLNDKAHHNDVQQNQSNGGYHKKS